MSIRAIWEYSNSIWLERYKHVHSSSDDNPSSLNHIELQLIIRNYLKIELSELSADEKKLNLNVAQAMKYAHTKTLARWLELHKTEREAALRRKRESRGTTQTK